jgi:Domain of unknown function (DUF4340)
MKSRLLVNVGLLTVIAILATIAIVKPGKEEVEPSSLLAVDPQGLTHVTLQNKETLVFEKIDGQWRLTAPFAAPVNQVRIGQLLDVTKATSEANYPLKPDEVAQFGLDEPQAVLTLGKNTLQFGGTDPIKMRRYVRLGDTLHLVEDNFFHHLTAAATDYVDKRLIPEGAKIHEIQLPGLKAIKNAEGKWTVEPAGESGIDLAELASVWATSRAIDVKRMDTQVVGETIRIGLVDGAPIEFVILKKSPELVLGRRDLGLQYEVTGETSRELLNQPKQKSLTPSVNEQDRPEGETTAPHDESDESGQDVGHDDDEG